MQSGKHEARADAQTDEGENQEHRQPGTRTARAAGERRADGGAAGRGELEALAHRWQVVRLLDEGVPYLEIAERVHTSTATVTRVAQWLRHGTGGYQLVLRRTR